MRAYSHRGTRPNGILLLREENVNLSFGFICLKGKRSRGPLHEINPREYGFEYSSRIYSMNLLHESRVLFKQINPKLRLSRI